uniref:SWI/SNF-related matrix-associated actin-dependent regulator of chromatin subfamily A containing DEAD/H box 1 homolog n=1 Tax=Trichuris muris TaxID=70415 RepID=A0A5S6QSC2_TRIMR
MRLWGDDVEVPWVNCLLVHCPREVRRDGIDCRFRGPTRYAAVTTSAARSELPSSNEVTAGLKSEPSDDSVNLEISGESTNSLLADSLNRWKEWKKSEDVSSPPHGGCNDEKQEDGSSFEDSGSDGERPSRSASKRKRTNSSEDAEAVDSEVASDDESDEVQSNCSEYQPTSASDDSSEGEWLNREAMKQSYAARKRQLIAYREQRNLSSGLISHPPKVQFDTTKFKSSLEMLRHLREERQKRRQQQTGGSSKKLSAGCSNETEFIEAPKVVIPTNNCETKAQNVKKKANRIPDDEDSYGAGLLKSRQILLSDEDDDNEGVGCAVNSNDAIASNERDDDSGAESLSCFPSLGTKRVRKRKVLMASDDETDNQGDSSEASAEVELNQGVSKSSKLRFKAMCLQFFETANEDELAAVPRCSRRMAKLIIEARPFGSFDRMMKLFEDRKGISTVVCKSYKQSVQLQGSLDKLLHSCEKIAAKLEKHISQMKEHSKGWVSKLALLSDSLALKPYQLVGLNWLILLREHGVNAVLADEMGLGKTVQVIAFLAYLKEHQVNQPNLIIVPASTLDNWLSELNRWCSSLSVLTYYGSAEDRCYIRQEVDCGRLSGFDVVLTTYQMAVGNSQDRAFHKRLKINYAIFDEAHMLKSCTTTRYKKLMQVNARQRILLTGTPLQNNLVELVSLMHFVMPKLFMKYAHNLKELLACFEVKNTVSALFKSSKIEQAKRIMKPFTLRRLKSEVLEQLPKKHERLELCELTETQGPLYNQLMSYCSDVLRDDADGTEKSQGNLCAMFMQLRKAANHPLLLRSLYTDETVRKMAKVLFKKGKQPMEVFYEELLEKSDFALHKLCCQNKKLFRLKLPISAILNSAKISALERILPDAKSKGSKVLLFSQFTTVLDILETYLQHKKYTYVRLDGSTPVVARKGLIDHFNESDVFVFLLSTRAGGLGVNLTSANIIILHDIDYNPHNDRQAEDRCHRVGQTKDVYVVKLIAKNTIDETMLACAQKKLVLERKVTAADDEEDIKSLLRQVFHS